MGLTIWISQVGYYESASIYELNALPATGDCWSVVQGSCDDINFVHNNSKVHTTKFYKYLNINKKVFTFPLSFNKL
jgi:hypothetical protein